MRIDPNEIVVYDNVDYYLFLLTQRQRQLLSSLLVSAEWRATFYHPDDTTFDDMQELVAATVRQLGEYEELNQITAALDNITQEIKQLELATTMSVTCCDQTTPPNPPTPPTGDNPPGQGTPPPAYGGDDAVYSTAVCNAMNAVHWQIRKWLVALSGLNVAAGVLAIIVAILAIVFPDPVSTAIGGVTLVTIVSAILLVEGGLATVSAWAQSAVPAWDSYQQQFVITSYNAYGTYSTWAQSVTQQVQTQIVQAISGLPGSIENVIFDWLEFYLQHVADLVYNDTLNLEPHPNPLPCSQPVLYTWTFDSTLEDLEEQRTTHYPAESCLRLTPNSGYVSQVGAKLTAWQTAGLALGTYTNVKIEFSYSQGSDNDQGFPSPQDIVVMVRDDTGNLQTIGSYDGMSAPISNDPDGNGVTLTYTASFDCLWDGGGGDWFFIIIQEKTPDTGHWRIGHISLWGDPV